MLMSDLKIGEHTYDLYDDDAHNEIHSLDARVTDLEEGGVIPGPPGPAGFSPEAEVHRLTATESIFTVTDKKGTTSVTIKDGAPGPQGERGPQGEPGKDAASGFVNDNLLSFGDDIDTQRGDTLSLPGDIVKITLGTYENKLTATYNIDGSISIVPDSLPFNPESLQHDKIYIKKFSTYNYYNSPNFIISVFSEENVPINISYGAKQIAIDNNSQLNYPVGIVHVNTEFLTITDAMVQAINDKGYFRYGMKLEESIDKIKTAWTPYTGYYLIPLPKSPGSDDLSSIYRRIRAALNHRLYFVFYDGLTIPYYKNITNYGVLTLNSNLLDRNLSSTISTDNTNTVKLTINLSTSDYYYGIQNDSLSINKWGSSVPLPQGILVEL